MFEIKNETIYLNNSKIYKELSKQIGVRDCQKDGRTLSVDNLKVHFSGCDFICEGDIPEGIFEDLDL